MANGAQVERSTGGARRRTRLQVLVDLYRTTILYMLVPLGMLPVLSVTFRVFVCGGDDADEVADAFASGDATALAGASRIAEAFGGEEFCWQGTHLLVVILAVLQAPLMLSLTLVQMLTMFDRRLDSPSLFVRFFGRADMIDFTFGILLSIVLSLMFGTAPKWLVVAATSAIMLGSCYMQYVTMPQVRPVMDDANMALMCCAAWQCLVSMLGLVLADDADLSMFALLGLVPAATFGMFLVRSRRSHVVSSRLSDLTSESDIANWGHHKFTLAHNIASSGALNSVAAVLQSDMFSEDVDASESSMLLAGGTLDGGDVKRDRVAELLSQAEAAYTLLSTKFAKSSNAATLAAMFYRSHLVRVSHYMELRLLARAWRLTSAWDIRLEVLLRLGRLLEVEAHSVGSGDANGRPGLSGGWTGGFAGGPDKGFSSAGDDDAVVGVVGALDDSGTRRLRFEAHQAAAAASQRATSRAMVRLWNRCLAPTLSIAVLHEHAVSVQRHRLRLERHLKRMVTLNPTSSPILRLYAAFCLRFLQDEVMADVLLSQAERLDTIAVEHHSGSTLRHIVPFTRISNTTAKTANAHAIAVARVAATLSTVGAIPLSTSAGLGADTMGAALKALGLQSVAGGNSLIIDDHTGVMLISGSEFDFGRIITVNAAATSMLQAPSRSEVEGSNLLHWLPPPYSSLRDTALHAMASKHADSLLNRWFVSLAVSFFDTLVPVRALMQETAPNPVGACDPRFTLVFQPLVASDAEGLGVVAVSASGHWTLMHADMPLNLLLGVCNEGEMPPEDGFPLRHVLVPRVPPAKSAAAGKTSKAPDAFIGSMLPDGTRQLAMRVVYNEDASQGGASLDVSVHFTPLRVPAALLPHCVEPRAAAGVHVQRAVTAQGRRALHASEARAPPPLRAGSVYADGSPGRAGGESPTRMALLATQQDEAEEDIVGYGIIRLSIVEEMASSAAAAARRAVLRGPNGSSPTSGETPRQLAAARRVSAAREWTSTSKGGRTPGWTPAAGVRVASVRSKGPKTPLAGGAEAGVGMSRSHSTGLAGDTKGRLPASFLRPQGLSITTGQPASPPMKSLHSLPLGASATRASSDVADTSLDRDVSEEARVVTVSSTTGWEGITGHSSSPTAGDQRRVSDTKAVSAGATPAKLSIGVGSRVVPAKSVPTTVGVSGEMLDDAAQTDMRGRVSSVYQSKRSVLSGGARSRRSLTSADGDSHTSAGSAALSNSLRLLRKLVDHSSPLTLQPIRFIRWAYLLFVVLMITTFVIGLVFAEAAAAAEGQFLPSLLSHGLLGFTAAHLYTVLWGAMQPPTSPLALSAATQAVQELSAHRQALESLTASVMSLEREQVENSGPLVDMFASIDNIPSVINAITDPTGVSMADYGLPSVAGQPASQYDLWQYLLQELLFLEDRLNASFVLPNGTALEPVSPLARGAFSLQHPRTQALLHNLLDVALPAFNETATYKTQFWGWVLDLSFWYQLLTISLIFLVVVFALQSYYTSSASAALAHIRDEPLIAITRLSRETLKEFKASAQQLVAGGLDELVKAAHDREATQIGEGDQGARSPVPAETSSSFERRRSTTRASDGREASAADSLRAEPPPAVASSPAPAEEGRESPGLYSHTSFRVRIPFSGSPSAPPAPAASTATAVAAAVPTGGERDATSASSAGDMHEEAATVGSDMSALVKSPGSSRRDAAPAEPVQPSATLQPLLMEATTPTPLLEGRHDSGSGREASAAVSTEEAVVLPSHPGASDSPLVSSQAAPDKAPSGLALSGSGREALEGQHSSASADIMSMLQMSPETAKRKFAASEVGSPQGKDSGDDKSERGASDMSLGTLLRAGPSGVKKEVEKGKGGPGLAAGRPERRGMRLVRAPTTRFASTMKDDDAARGGRFEMPAMAAPAMGGAAGRRAARGRSVALAAATAQRRKRAAARNARRSSTGQFKVVTNMAALAPMVSLVVFMAVFWPLWGAAHRDTTQHGAAVYGAMQAAQHSILYTRALTAAAIEPNVSIRELLVLQAEQVHAEDIRFRLASLQQAGPTQLYARHDETFTSSLSSAPRSPITGSNIAQYEEGSGPYDLLSSAGCDKRGAAGAVRAGLLRGPVAAAHVASCESFENGMFTAGLADALARTLTVGSGVAFELAQSTPSPSASASSSPAPPSASPTPSVSPPAGTTPSPSPSAPPSPSPSPLAGDTASTLQADLAFVTLAESQHMRHALVGVAYSSMREGLLELDRLQAAMVACSITLTLSALIFMVFFLWPRVLRVGNLALAARSVLVLVPPGIISQTPALKDMVQKLTSTGANSGAQVKKSTSGTSGRERANSDRSAGTGRSQKRRNGSIHASIESTKSSNLSRAKSMRNFMLAASPQKSDEL